MEKINCFYIYVILVLLLTSCGHDIHEGKVIEKYYEPSRYYTYITTTIVGRIIIPQTHTAYDDEDWIIVVENIECQDTITQRFYLDESNHVALTVFDSRGRTVSQLMNRHMPMGHHRVQFNGEHLLSGIYFYQLKTKKYAITKKCLLLQ